MCDVGGDDCTAKATWAEVKAWVASQTSGTSCVVFNTDDDWTWSSESDAFIARTNTIIAKFGSGARPIIDAGGVFDSKNDAAIVFGNYEAVTGPCWVTGIEFRNTDQGAAIRFSGTNISYRDDRWYTTGGGVDDCVIHDIGWSAVGINGVVRGANEDDAVVISNTEIYDYANRLGAGVSSPRTYFPQAINGGEGSWGHICRDTIIRDGYGEGIGGSAFSIVERCIFSGNGNPAIYIAGADSNFDFSSIDNNYVQHYRYNLVIANTENDYENHKSYQPSGIRIATECGYGEEVPDCEGPSDRNHYRTLLIYGNIIAGPYTFGLSFAVDPEGKDGGLGGTYGADIAFKRVDIVNNTVIDANTLMQFKRGERVLSGTFANNLFVINSDAEASCSHFALTNTPNMDNWGIIGPNHWYGDTVSKPGVGDLIYNANDITTDPKLGKSSGFRSIAIQQSPVLGYGAWCTAAEAIVPFSSFIPASDGGGVDWDDAITTVDDTYTDMGRYLVTGTNHFDLIDTSTFVRSHQSVEGNLWDSGAVLSKGNIDYPNGVIDTPATPQTKTEGESVNFTGTASGGSGSGYTYLWNFGGGAASSTSEDPGSVTFSTAGTYECSLTVTDGAGHTDPTPATTTVQVNPSGGGESYVLEESFGADDNGSSAFGQYSWSDCVFCDFTTSGAYDVDRIVAKLLKVGSPTSNLVAEIWTDSGGSPLAQSGSSSGTVAGSTLSTDGGGTDIVFDFASSISLLGSTKYWMAVCAASLDTTNYYKIRRDGGTVECIKRCADDGTSCTGCATAQGTFSIYSKSGASTPVISNITTATVDGTYGDTDSIGPFTVTFSEAVDISVTAAGYSAEHTDADKDNTRIAFTTDDDTANNYIAASFTASSSYDLARVASTWYRVGTGNTNVVAYITADDSGEPDDQNILATSAAVDMSGITTAVAGEAVNFDFASPASLTNAQQYWVIYYGNLQGSNTNHVVLRYYGDSGETHDILRDTNMLSWSVIDATASQTAIYYSATEASAPYLTFETGDNDLTSILASAVSGSATASFPAITVDAGEDHETSDLDVISLTLDGETITADDDSTPADTSVPTGSGTVGSLAYNKDIVISTAANPYIIGIDPVTVDGTYDETTDVIEFDVVWNQPVEAYGEPDFAKIAHTLDHPATTLYSYIVGGSGTNRLRFRLSGLVKGVRMSSFNYDGVNSLTLNNGTIAAVTGGAAATLTMIASGSGDLADETDIIIAIPITQSDGGIMVCPE